VSDEGRDFDIAAIFAHPDDAELVVGGTLAKEAARGRRVAGAPSRFARPKPRPPPGSWASPIARAWDSPMRG
jgi:hypothetical protein